MGGHFGETHVAAKPGGMVSGCPQPMAMRARGRGSRYVLRPELLRGRLLTQAAELNAFALGSHPGRVLSCLPLYRPANHAPTPPAPPEARVGPCIRLPRQAA